MRSYYAILCIFTYTYLYAGDISLKKICEDRDMKSLKALIATSHGRSIVNSPDDEGRTLLTYAVEKEEVEMVDFLLKADIDPNIPNNDGWTPYMVAVRTCNNDIINLFIKHDQVNIHTAAHNGETLFTVAALWNPEILSALLQI